MTTSAAQMVIEYPEFAAIHAEDAGLIAAVLARAERRIGTAWPEAVRDDIVYLQCADMLARGPWGRNARMSELGTAKDPGKPNVYAAELAERKKAFAFARSRAVE